jgi:hypothetical protein
LRARDYTTINPFEPFAFCVTPDTRFWVTFSPLRGRAALTVEAAGLPKDALVEIELVAVL